MGHYGPMNLNTAALLGDRFLNCVAQGGLIDKLNAIMEAGNAILENSDIHTKVLTPSNDLKTISKEAIDALDDSVFSDASMKVFPEFEQLGLSTMMGNSIRAALGTFANGEEVGAEQMEKSLVEIGNDIIIANELGDYVSTLLSVAEYFGVEKREVFDADAIAVIQMPKSENETPEDVDNFVNWMQAFQNITRACKGYNDITHNIRMISGDDPLVVADMSVKGAERLRSFVSEARKVQSNVAEIESAKEKLASVGVSESILSQLSEEGERFRSFDTPVVTGFLSLIFGEEQQANAKDVASQVRSLIDGGVRVDSVVLNTTEESEDDTLEEEPTKEDTGLVASAAALVAEGEDAVSDIVEETEETIAEAVETATQTAGEVVSDAREAVVETVTETVEEISETVTETAENLNPTGAITAGVGAAGAAVVGAAANTLGDEETNEEGAEEVTSNDTSPEAGADESTGEETSSKAETEKGASDEPSNDDAQTDTAEATVTTQGEGSEETSKVEEPSAETSEPVTKSRFKSIWDTISNRS